MRGGDRIPNGSILHCSLFHPDNFFFPPYLNMHFLSILYAFALHCSLGIKERCTYRFKRGDEDLYVKVAKSGDDEAFTHPLLRPAQHSATAAHPAAQFSLYLSLFSPCVLHILNFVARALE